MIASVLQPAAKEKFMDNTDMWWMYIAGNINVIYLDVNIHLLIVLSGYIFRRPKYAYACLTLRKTVDDIPTPSVHVHFRLRCCPCPILWGWLLIILMVQAIPFCLLKHLNIKLPGARVGNRTCFVIDTINYENMLLELTSAFHKPLSKINKRLS